mmetsp:Transcript_9782/g.16389  ORF Transcript_9782/g.16389 Transcript_9782/m.16389 type:complete len:222 (-) Transcript_9782:874-1539(-)
MDLPCPYTAGRHSNEAAAYGKLHSNVAHYSALAAAPDASPEFLSHLRVAPRHSRSSVSESVDSRCARVSGTVNDRHRFSCCRYRHHRLSYSLYARTAAAGSLILRQTSHQHPYLQPCFYDISSLVPHPSVRVQQIAPTYSIDFDIRVTISTLEKMLLFLGPVDVLIVAGEDSFELCARLADLQFEYRHRHRCTSEEFACRHWIVPSPALLQHCPMKGSTAS